MTRGGEQTAVSAVDRATGDEASAARSRPTASRIRAHPRALLTLSRPRQWLKNVLVLVAPLAAARITEPSIAVDAAIGLVAFTIAASGVYWINDALDARSDQLHPTKRLRPVAAGRVSRATALYGGFALELAAVALAGVAVNLELAGLLFIYAALQLAYSVTLKRVPVVELMVVAAGFVLRALAGGVATGIGLTDWFLIVTTFGALFVVAGKRYAESIAMGELAGEHRAVLDHYPRAFLQQVVGVCLAVTLLAYCLWAFGTSTSIDGASRGPWIALSVVPVTLISLRYLLLVAAGRTGEPEELVLRDRVTGAGVVVSAVMVLFGLYW